MRYSAQDKSHRDSASNNREYDPEHFLMPPIQLTAYCNDNGNKRNDQPVFIMGMKPYTHSLFHIRGVCAFVSKGTHYHNHPAMLSTQQFTRGWLKQERPLKRPFLFFWLISKLTGSYIIDRAIEPGFLVKVKLDRIPRYILPCINGG